MKSITQRKPSRLPILAGLAAVLAILLALAASSAAGAQEPPKASEANCSTGRTVPASKISIQLWTFNRYIERGELMPGAPADAPGATATRAERLEYVFAFLSE